MVLPNQLVCSVLSTSDEYISFQQTFMSSTDTDKNNPFSRCTYKQSQLQTIPNRAPIKLSRIAFPTTVMPKDDRKIFTQEDRLGLPYWTMILAICVVADVSKYLNLPIFEFSAISEHLPFLLGCKKMLHQLLVLRILVTLKIFHYFCGSHLRWWWSLFCEHCIRAWIVINNITSKCNSTFILLVFLL